jgi:hypothetical protein
MRPSSWISELHTIYCGDRFNRFYDTVKTLVKSWKLGATFTQSHNPHEREKHGGIELCDCVKKLAFTLSHYCVFAKRKVVDWGVESCDCVNGVKPAPSPSVEFSRIANKVKGVKRVKPVKKLRGVGLGVELGFTMHGISIESGVICISFYKGQYNMQIVNNLANLLNFSITGWWA